MMKEGFLRLSVEINKKINQASIHSKSISVICQEGDKKNSKKNLIK